MNEQPDEAQNEQAQFDEVKNIEREAASKAPYKGSYTVNVDEETKPKASTRKSSADRNNEIRTR
jgi:hypothetical protein